MLIPFKNTSKLFITLFVLFIVATIGCETQKNPQGQLDYSTIPLIELQKKFTIIETENFIPAQVTKLMVSDDGYILVSQRADKGIHQFDSLGNYLIRVAGPGRGPGELSQYANAHFNGKVLVMSNNNGFLTEYRQNDEGIFEYRTDHKVRLPGVLRAIRSLDDFSEFYVTVDSVRTPFGTVPPKFTKDFVHLVRLSEDSLNVEEKVFSLLKHSSYVKITDGGNSMSYSYLPYRFSDYISSLPDKKLLVTRPNDSAVQIFDGNLNLINELVLNVKDRPVTERDMEFHFPDDTRTERSEKRKLINDTKPPFTKVLLDDQNRFWLYTDETEKGKEFVILSYEGYPLGRVYIPSEMTLFNIKNDKLFLVNNALKTSIEVFTVEI